MTEGEKGLAFPRSTSAANTEARAVRTVELPRGGTMRITGSKPPCNNCKFAMKNTAQRSEGRIIYQWREGGETQTREWDYRPNED
jgi:Pput_2613-like deaminase